MNMKKLQLAIQVMQKIFPVVKKIIEDVAAAKDPNSQGGKKITPEERHDIIFNNITNVIPVIDDVIKEL